MRWIAFLLAFVVVSTDDEALTKDRKALQGSWTVTAAQEDGRPLDRIKGNTLIVDGDKFTIKTKTSDLKGTLVLHPSITPKGMDLTHTAGAVEGRVWYANYVLEENVLKICYKDSNPEKQRPGKFASSVNSGLLLITLKRDDP